VGMAVMEMASGDGSECHKEITIADSAHSGDTMGRSCILSKNPITPTARSTRIKECRTYSTSRSRYIKRPSRSICRTVGSVGLSLFSASRSAATDVTTPPLTA
jgi:hypothetical protein